MNFHSFAFFLFFVVFLAVYHGLRRKGQNALLLAGSYLFYAAWDVRFLALLGLTTLVDYSVGRALGRTERTGTRKTLVWVSIVFNLGILGFFKYFAFFQAEACRLAALAGIVLSPVALQILLPVGISFYTFKSLSYTIDVYRKTIPPTDRLQDHALYIAFFPQLLAGPIERAAVLRPQIRAERTLTWDKIRVGSFEIGWGLVLKVFAADNLALLVNNLLHAPEATGFTYLLAGYAFTFQILGDFAGYSYLSNGVARLLGFDTMRNFRLPYFANGPREFWRRWHISLSTWLRDYLYIPLGGNRSGHRRTRCNLMVTMVLGGLWHGANLTFIVWGAYHGLLLVLQGMLSTGKAGDGDRNRCASLSAAVLKWLVFFHCVVIGWLIFRADSLQQAGQIFLTMLGNWRLDWAANAGAVRRLVLYVTPILAMEGLQYWRRDLLAVLHLPLPIRAGVYVLFFYLVVVFGFYGAHDFLYMRF